MNLHVEVTGSGAPLVMLHGWGMHGGIWSDLAGKLAADFQVHNVDLPGHGRSMLPSPAGGITSDLAALPRSRMASSSTRGAGGEGSAGQSLSLTLSRPRERGLDLMDIIVDELSSSFPEQIDVCGWSLGGIIAQHWAVREPEKIRRLVLVNSTPCFAAREGWACGMPQETLAQFAAELEQNHTATLCRFLALQVRGSEGERELLGTLRKKLFDRGEPHLEALRGGLAILRDADLRDVLPQITQPTLVIAGERDRLAPPEASRYLARSLPHARAVVVEGAAHAPFLSHAEIFVGQVCNFLKDN